MGDGGKQAYQIDYTVVGLPAWRHESACSISASVIYGGQQKYRFDGHIALVSYPEAAAVGTDPKILTLVMMK